MRRIEAIVRPFVIDRVRERLGEIGVGGLTVVPVRGIGRQKGQTEVYRGAEYQIEFLPKLKLEIAVTESQVEKVVSAIEETCRTGRIGDGKIFVSQLVDVVRVRTGERGQAALT